MWLAASSGCWAADHSMCLIMRNSALVDRCDFATRYRCPLEPATGLSAPAPRSGLERSDFVLWPDSEVAECVYGFRFLGYSGLVVLTASLSESDPKRSWAISASIAQSAGGLIALRAES